MAIALLLLILLPVVYQLCAPTPAPGELVQRSLGARIALGCALGISYVLLLVSLYRLIVGTTVGNLARALKVLGACAMVIGVLFGGVGTWFTVDLLSGKLDHAGTEGSSHHHFDWD